jgi:outer membrane immunogenic protein
MIIMKLLLTPRLSRYISCLSFNSVALHGAQTNAPDDGKGKNMKLQSLQGLSALLGALAVTAAGAQAADLGSTKDYGYVAADMPGSWSGAYIGAGAAAVFGGAVVHAGASGDKLNLSNGSSAGGTLYIGRNWQFGSWVAGVEADLSYSDLQQSGTNAVLGNVKAEEQDFGALKLRGGYAFGNLLAYGTTGLEVTHVKVSGSHLTSDQNTVNATLLLGAGLEYNTGQDWILRSEAKIYGMGQSDVEFTGGARDLSEGTAAFTFGVARKF